MLEIFGWPTMGCELHQVDPSLEFLGTWGATSKLPHGTWLIVGSVPGELTALTFEDTLVTHWEILAHPGGLEGLIPTRYSRRGTSW